MKDNVLHVGLDVDDKSFHGCGYFSKTKEFYPFKTKPNTGSLIRKLKQLQSKGYTLKICYEATYIGFDLCRDLQKKKLDCEIIAPSLIPEKPSSRVKTDRLDCRKLAEYYAAGLLTPIYIPSEEDEELRDMLRSRKFLIEQRKKIKVHITSFCRRNKLHYRGEHPNGTYWTQMHLAWLSKMRDELSPVAQLTLDALIYSIERLTDAIDVLEDNIVELSENERYKEKKDALICFRGISELSAMSLIVEIGDVRRFTHPKKLTSYAGMDIAEYSSGGKEKKFGITKMGNRQIRTIVVEACQSPAAQFKISRRLKLKRKGKDLSIIEIADRCMIRIRKKAWKMISAGKHINKVKVACGREMLSFIWEALQLKTN